MDAVAMLALYLSAIARHERVDPMVFESVVTAWLEDGVRGETLPDIERLFGAPFLATLHESTVVAAGG